MVGEPHPGSNKQCQMNKGSTTVRLVTKLDATDGSAPSRSTWLANEFRLSYGWLKSKLQRRVGSPVDAEDLASSSFAELAAVHDLATVREPRAFLTVIAQRLTFEMWRRRDLERAYLDSLRIQEQSVSPSAESIAQISQALLLVDQALSGLPPKARSAFIYSQIDGLTYAEIATRLGVSTSMVRKYITQALTRCYLTN
jgi:RNA polymerase sigma-19 factor, ECF subfamily